MMGMPCRGAVTEKDPWSEMTPGFTQICEICGAYPPEDIGLAGLSRRNKSHSASNTYGLLARTKGWRSGQAKGI